jgi:hypothetical protein
VDQQSVGERLLDRSVALRGTLGLGLVLLLLFCLPLNSAWATGGANIASAPTVVFGQHEFGNTDHGSFGGCPDPAEYWLLSLGAGDQATIDWETTSEEYAEELNVYPAGTTDFSINNADTLAEFGLGSNDHAESVFHVGATGVYPIVFYGRCDGAGGPYDFTATVQHALLVTLKHYAHIKTTTVVTAVANLASGGPPPDGLAFTLTVSWGRESAAYTAASSGGNLSFPLALPETAKGKTATLEITRAADSQFQEAKSEKLEVKVGSASVTPEPSACEMATAHAHSLARRYKRLKEHSFLAHGPTRRRLRRRARQVLHALKFARSEAASACGTA